MAHSMIKSLRSSIATKLLTAVFSIYLIVTLTATVIHLSIEYYETRTTILKDIEASKETFELGLTRAIWNGNEKQVKALVEGIQLIPFIVGVHVETDLIGNFSSGITTHHQPETEQTLFSRSFSHSAPLNFSGLIGGTQRTSELGVVTLYSNNDIVWQRIRFAFFSIIMNAVIKTIALWFIFLWVSRIILTRPLTHLTEDISKIDLNNLEASNVMPVTDDPNELKTLEKTFNTMVLNLRIARDQLKQLNLDQEMIIKERTQQLGKSLKHLEYQHEQMKKTQVHLVQSEKMASLGTLVAGVAHEVNNPINFMVMGVGSIELKMNRFQEFCDDLLEGNPPEVTDEFRMWFEQLESPINIVKEGAERVQGIVKDLRTFSHLGKAERKKAQIVDSVHSTVRLLKTQYDAQITFQSDLQADPEIVCFPSQLNQAFMNIMVNACQAIVAKQESSNEAGLGHIRVSSEIENDYLKLSFEDDGCGMDETVKKKMFDPFYTTKEVGVGTGLGMSISFGILERHHGRIEVTSTPNLGTNVTLFLPLHPEGGEEDTMGFPEGTEDLRASLPGKPNLN